MKLSPAKRLRGRLRLPGDKSISHRAAILASLALGRTVVSNYSTSADCASTLACLARVGVELKKEGASVVVEGAGRESGEWGFAEDAAPLDCGNSGTTMRLLAGVLAAQPFSSTLTGDRSLSRRPMRRVIEPLEMMGARVSSDRGCAPLRIEGRRPLVAIEYEMPVASAQVKSCVLLAGLGARGPTRVIESGGPTRDHTERMLRWFGVDVESSVIEREDGTEAHVVELDGPARLVARDLEVPGDISSAAFLLAAAALLPGSDLSIESVGLNPTRARIVDALRDLGADVRARTTGESCNEPVGVVEARGGAADRLVPTGGVGAANLLRGAVTAQLIDELPLLAVVGSQVEGGIVIRDAAELRVKESDRIRATVENLRAMGVEVEELGDGMHVHGPAQLRGARLDSFGDHRIAMAFTVAALTAEGETEIAGAKECVGISFPEFFDLLDAVTEK